MATPAAVVVDGAKACTACGVLKLLDEFRTPDEWREAVV